MTTDVVNTIVASDEKNVNKFDKDRGFSQIVDAGRVPAIFILMRIAYGSPMAEECIGLNYP
jgi:hypothetical protein